MNQQESLKVPKPLEDDKLNARNYWRKVLKMLIVFLIIYVLFPVFEKFSCPVTTGSCQDNYGLVFVMLFGGIVFGIFFVYFASKALYYTLKPRVEKISVFESKNFWTVFIILLLWLIFYTLLVSYGRKLDNLVSQNI